MSKTFDYDANNRTPVDRDGPVIRKSIVAPVSRPAKTQIITDHYAAAGRDIDVTAVLAKNLFWLGVIYVLWLVQQ